MITAAPLSFAPLRAVTTPILVVDDEPGIRSLVRDSLTLAGYGIALASTLAEARELLRTRSFSLVISDYQLEDGDGLELIRYVTRVHPDVPVVLMTGLDEVGVGRSAIASGAVEFLPKPFAIPQLLRVVEQSWERVLHNQQRAASLTEEVLAGTIRALVAAMDAKDPFTASHSERVTLLALRLGEALQLPRERLRVLEFGALLHDVGKIAVPEQILRKPDRLTDDEWALIRLHPEKSAEIVGQVAPLANVATIVRHHHERMDGRGYPDGLMGEAVPYLSRIIGIADAYEAMTADRAYRGALTPEQARAIIREELGRQFDPALGQVFLSLTDLP